MLKVRLGHNQVFRMDGTVLDGVREIDVDVTTREVDVTPYNHAFASTLPTVVDASLSVKLYWPEEMPEIWNKLLQHPKAPVQLSIDGLVFGSFVVVSVKVGCPMGGVVPHDVTFKMWNYA